MHNELCCFTLGFILEFLWEKKYLQRIENWIVPPTIFTGYVNKLVVKDKER